MLTLGEGSNCVGCVLCLFFHYNDDYVFLSFIDFLGDIGIFPDKKFKCKFANEHHAQGIFLGKPLTKGRSRLGLLCMQFFQKGGETKKQTKNTIGHLTTL